MYISNATTAYASGKDYFFFTTTTSLAVFGIPYNNPTVSKFQ